MQTDSLNKNIAVTVFVRKNQFANSVASQPLPKLFKNKHMGNSYTS